MAKNPVLYKSLVVGVIVLFIVVGVQPVIAINDSIKPIINGNTLYVGGTGPGNYTKIQFAIDDAVDGDTIFVFNDSSPYFENLWVRKSISIIGENRDTTVIDGNWNEVYVFRIEADYVEISGFTMINSGNAVEMWSNHSSINDNFITNNVWDGIFLYKSHDNILSNNNIMDNGGGIYLSGSNNNIIMENVINKHDHYGISFDYSICNNISGNIIGKSTDNIRFHFFSSGNIIRKNIFNNSRSRGILIMYGSDNNTICSNTFANSKWYGLQLETDGNIVCYNNFINNNADHAVFVRITLVTTIINRNKWYGNYWDDWIGLEQPSYNRFPKIVIGHLYRGRIKIPSFAFDWFPAKEPYDI